MESNSLQKLAVLVRAHASDEKTLDLIAALSGSSNYDLLVCMNETNGPISLPDNVNKISVRASDFERLGFPCTNQYTMLYLSDVLFAIIRHRLPGYAHYALIEYDVHFEVDAKIFMNELSDRLVSKSEDYLDLVATNVTDQESVWLWHASSSRRYSQVISAFFPFVVLSNRAITQLSAAREDERLSRLRRGFTGEPSAGGSGDDWVFCEAFIASELNRAGFTIADLNWISERAYHGKSFNVGPAHFFEHDTTYDAEAKIVHPVCPMRDTLAKRQYLASTNGTMAEFLNLLNSRSWPLEDEVIEEMRKKAIAHLENS